MYVYRTFVPDARSAGQARWFVRESLEEWGVQELTDSVLLSVSELVTNAVVHAGTAVRLSLRLDAASLRVEVEDSHPHRALPVGVDSRSPNAEGGRGLLIISTLASTWGVDYTQGSKRVWLEFERPNATVAAPMPSVAAGATVGDHAQVAVVEVSNDGTISAWNADAAGMFGWAEAEALGRVFGELVQSDRSTGNGVTAPWSSGERWQGTYAVRRKNRTPVEVFASHTPAGKGDSAIALLVAAGERALLEESPRPRGRPPKDSDAVGVREEALTRLGLDNYLTLAVERARDRLSADATYLLLARDFDPEYEVRAVSGLDDSLRGTRLDARDPGAPDSHNPQLPVAYRDLSDTQIPLLAGSGMRSLVVVPVVVEGRVTGALGAASESVDGFTDEQSVLLQRIADAIAIAADRARLQTSERERRGWLSFLAEAGDLLAGSLDQRMTIAITGQIVIPRLATWCAVYLDDGRKVPVLQQVWHADERRNGPLRTALEHVEPGEAADSDDDQLWGEVLDIPLSARGRRIGLMTLGRPHGEPLAGEALLVAESVARRAAVAIDNARAHGDLRAVGQTLQRSLLPSSMPVVPYLDVGVVYEAAGESSTVGGDFYDLFSIGANRWCFVVGDVCGTGAEAAAVTGLARHTIRALALAGFPVAAILERLNSAILEEGERSRFLTLVCGTLEPEPGRRVRMSMVSAGHPLPFVVHSSGAVHQIGRPQSLLGVLAHVQYTAEDQLLERGDMLVTVTDGVLERREGDRMLGETGLMAELTHTASMPAQAVAERIRRLVVDYAHTPQSDDMAVLVLRGFGSPAPAEGDQA
jgi:serine phosphatase RsbU (regulator of sigma subunit)/anti-sigma regulatory factor (Ser/Thr protein kinase)